MIEQILVLFIMGLGLTIIVGGPKLGKRYLLGSWRHVVVRPTRAIFRIINRLVWRGLNVSWRWVSHQTWRGICFSFRRIGQAFARVGRTIAGLI